MINHFGDDVFIWAMEGEYLGKSPELIKHQPDTFLPADHDRRTSRQAARIKYTIRTGGRWWDKGQRIRVHFRRDIRQTKALFQCFLAQITVVHVLCAVVIHCPLRGINQRRKGHWLRPFSLRLIQFFPAGFPLPFGSQPGIAVIFVGVIQILRNEFRPTRAGAVTFDGAC